MNKIKTSAWDIDDTAWAAYDSYGYGNAAPAKKKDPAPVMEDGKEISQDEIRKRIAALPAKRKAMHETLKRITDPEAQARKARDLWEQINDEEDDLEDMLIEAGRWEAHRLSEQGIRRFGMADDEGDKIITKMVDEEAEWFHAEVDKIKDQLAERIQKRLDEVNADGRETPVKVRDNIYDSLVEQEVIEAWEPLEF